MVYLGMRDGVAEPSPFNGHVNDCFRRLFAASLSLSKPDAFEQEATQRGEVDDYGPSETSMPVTATDTLLLKKQVDSDGCWMVEGGWARVENLGRMRLPRIHKGGRRRVGKVEARKRVGGNRNRGDSK